MDGRLPTGYCPGESVQVGQSDLPIVPLNSTLREKLKLSGRLQTVVILLVDHITFADGSIRRPSRVQIVNRFLH